MNATEIIYVIALSVSGIATCCTIVFSIQTHLILRQIERDRRG